MNPDDDANDQIKVINLEDDVSSSIDVRQSLPNDVINDDVISDVDDEIDELCENLIDVLNDDSDTGELNI